MNLNSPTYSSIEEIFQNTSSTWCHFSVYVLNIDCHNSLNSNRTVEIISAEKRFTFCSRNTYSVAIDEKSLGLGDGNEAVRGATF